MAERISCPSRGASGIEVNQSLWHRTYLGTKDQLVAGGIVPAGVAFPGERDPKIYKTRPYQFTAANGHICKIRRNGKFRFSVSVPLSPDELNAAKAKAELAQGAIAAQRELQTLTARTAEDWREREASALFAMASASIKQLGGSKFHGFYMRQVDIDDIIATLEQAADRIRNAPVYFNRERQDARRQQLLAACAAGNDALQDFLVRAQAQAGQAS